MKLEHLAIMTGYMRKGMTLQDFFQEALRYDVPGLPYVNAQDEIVGRISIRNIYKRIAVPDNLISLADAIGDQTDNLDMQEMKVLEIMGEPVENYLLDIIPSVSPRSSIVKALALMEMHNSGYIFLIDNGKYLGVVTRMVIAKRMLQCVLEKGQKKSVLQ